MIRQEDRILVTSSTRHRDYIATAYEPRTDPIGKLHSTSVLRALLREHDLLSAWPICERLQSRLGREETVWGFKLGPETASLELYFYNFDQNGPDNPKSVMRLSEALSEQLRFSAGMDEKQPYFMCSFELTREGLETGSGGSFRIYVGSGDEERRECAFSYRVEPTSHPLENHYWFYRADRPAELGDAIRRLKRSPRAGQKGAWGRLMPRHLRACFTICYAVKPNADGLYYSRISNEQLIAFLEEHRPGMLCDLLAAHAHELDHLRWDLGFDFAAASPSAPDVPIHKIALHGVL